MAPKKRPAAALDEQKKKLTGMALVVAEGDKEGPVGKDVNSAVKYQLAKWKKSGWSYPEEEYKKCRSDQDRK
eukprot:4390872-Lingulodinium_polyedra.AAC.1